MPEPQIRFDDGAAYERLMGRWSRLAGEPFLNWLALPPRLTWLDVGCGSGAFTELIVGKSRASAVFGIDPSEGQLAFARSCPTRSVAQFTVGHALDLPFANHSANVAVMALVIFFVTDPVKAVAEMGRVVRHGGTVAAYAWDFENGGFPLNSLQVELRAMGVAPPLPPNVSASRLANLCDIWTEAGLKSVETLEISVERTFSDFDDFWTTSLAGAGIAATLATMESQDVDILKQRMLARMPTDDAGRVIGHATANAIKGRVGL